MVPNATATRTFPPRTAPAKVLNSWVVASCCILIGLACLYVAATRHRTLPPLDVRVEPPAVTLPAPAPGPQLAQGPTSSVTIAPRAERVTGPLTTAGRPMVSGNQYYVTMPDGRHLLVNWKGWVEHASNLPRQPKGGANNAAYTEAATGHMWIWTVPAGTSNIPRWIDP